MKETPKIYVVRPGQDKFEMAGKIAGKITDKKIDNGLSPTGIKQTRELAEKLENKNINAIYSSPLQNSVEAAKIIAHHLKVPHVIRSKGFTERDMGKLTGILLPDIPKNSSKVITGQRMLYCEEGPGVELFSAVLYRTRTTLRQIQNKRPNETLLIVTSEQVSKMIRAAYCGWDWQTGLQTPYFGHSDIIELSPKTNLS